MKVYRLVSILVFLVFCAGCEKGDSVNQPVEEIFPECMLTEINFTTSYGVIQKTILEYQEGKLAKRFFYSNGEFRSLKLFDYNENEEVNSMYSYDSTKNENSILASYEFENHLIKKFTHFNDYDSTVIQSLTFYYVDEHLSRMITENPGGIYEFEINTDEKGNVIYRKLVKINNKDPETIFETSFELDNKLNPFYRMPDFFSSFAWFNQNNIVTIINKVDGLQTSESLYINDYYENRFLKTEFFQFSQGTHTKEFVYSCN